MTIQVLLADDQHLVRAGFRYILNADPDIEVVAIAADGAEALQLAEETTPDVVLMDIQMPGMDGIEATRRIVAKGLLPRVLMLTTFDGDSYLYDALRAGASGFLLKDVPPEQLTAAVHTIAAGDALLAPALTRRLVERFIDQPPPTTEGPPALLAVLTPREMDVLRLVARGLSNREISAELFLGETTVKTHLARVLTKTGSRDRIQAVVLAYETGFVHAHHRGLRPPGSPGQGP